MKPIDFDSALCYDAPRQLRQLTTHQAQASNSAVVVSVDVHYPEPKQEQHGKGGRVVVESV